jgi:hypothetical protein
MGTLNERTACGVQRASERESCGLRPCWWTTEAQGFAGCERGWHAGWWALQIVRSHLREDWMVPVDREGVVMSNCTHL